MAVAVKVCIYNDITKILRLGILQSSLRNLLRITDSSLEYYMSHAINETVGFQLNTVILSREEFSFLCFLLEFGF